MAQQEVRQRKKSAKKQPKQKKKETTKEESADDKPTNTQSTAEDKEETLWETFINHPLGVILIVALVPFLSYRAFYFFELRRPDLITKATLGLVSMRPAVRQEDERQVLILGSMGSGTQQVSTGLFELLGLEVSYEATNAESYFARDGTVSNFLGIRYKPPPKDSKPGGHLQNVLNHLCFNHTKTSSDEFHSTFYRPSPCSFFKETKGCVLKECISVLGSQWGCGFLEDGCPTRFARVLHQVQHPMRTIRELMAKVCPGKAKTAHPSFMQTASVFLEEEQDSCLETVAWYVVNYNKALLAARKKGLIDAMFQYEQTSLCEIAELAGFVNSTHVVYPPSEGRVTKFCKTTGNTDDVNAPVASIATRSDPSRSLPKLAWEQFREVDRSLEKALKDLCKDLGYDPDEVEAEDAKEESEFQ